MASSSQLETQSTGIEVLETPNIPVIPFAVSLPSSTLQDFDDPVPKTSTISIVGDNAIVGSIVVLNNSVMVWVGWGNIDLYGSSKTLDGQAPSSFGKGKKIREILCTARCRFLNFNVSRCSVHGSGSRVHAKNEL